MELCDHTAQLSSHYAFAEHGNLKCPHLPIIDGDNWVDWWCWLLVGYGVGRHLTRDVPR